MSKELNLDRSVFELVEEYPELKGIMADLGFTEITKDAMLHSVGKLMTIPKGAKMKKIPMDKIIAAFQENGFKVTGSNVVSNTGAEDNGKDEVYVKPGSTRTEQLKSYLRRLGNGESLDDVRADFVKEFGEVKASEIMQAEQELMKEGTPLEEVQKLCDVHSALFHGATREEKIVNAEKEVEASIARQNAYPKGDYNNKAERASALEGTQGHPLQTLTREKDVLAVLLAEAKESTAQKKDIPELLSKIRELSIHYAKKGDLLYPLLNVKYGISGPSDVMWTVDDEIRDELGALEKETERGEWWFSRMDAVLTRAEEMIYKGIPVILMEPLRGGKLVDLLPQEAKAKISSHDRTMTPAELAFRWLWDQKEVTCVLSGMNSIEMVQENCSVADSSQIGDLTESDHALIYAVKAAIEKTTKVPCTGCGYCMPCPKGVDIPGAFRCYNNMYAEGKSRGRIEYFQVVGLRKNPALPTQCVACGKCESHCPQHINIISELKSANKALRPWYYRVANETARRWTVGR